MTMTVTAPWNPVHASFGMTGTSTKPVPVQQLRILYSKYGTRNNKVKSLMRATRGLVPLADKHPGGYPPGPHRYRLCCAGVSGFAECYGLSLLVMTTVTFRAAGIDPSERRPSTGTMAVRTSPTLWMVTADVPSEKRGIVFDLRTMLRLSWTACSTVWGVEASRM